VCFVYHRHNYPCCRYPYVCTLPSILACGLCCCTLFLGWKGNTKRKDLKPCTLTKTANRKFPLLVLKTNVNVHQQKTSVWECYWREDPSTNCPIPSNQTPFLTRRRKMSDQAQAKRPRESGPRIQGLGEVEIAHPLAHLACCPKNGLAESLERGQSQSSSGSESNVPGKTDQPSSKTAVHTPAV
jgi:hypothetical protein